MAEFGQTSFMEAPPQHAAPVVLSDESQLANVHEVLIRDGKALLLSPDGEPKQVPVAEAGEWIAKGYVPETDGEALWREGREAIRKHGGRAEAFGLGAMSGLTFGLTDIAATDPRTGMGRGTMQALEQERPVWRLGGELAGIGAQMMLPVPGAQQLGMARAGALGAGKGLATLLPLQGLGRAGEAASGALARIATRAPAMGPPARATAKLAGALRAPLVPAAEGLGIGAQQFISRGAIEGRHDPWDIVEPSLWGGALGPAFALGGRAIGRMRRGKDALREAALKSDVENFITPTTRAKLADASRLDSIAGAMEAGKKIPVLPGTELYAKTRALGFSAKSAREEASAIRKALDKTKTKSGVPVSKLEEELAKATERMSMLSAKAADKARAKAAKALEKGAKDSSSFGKYLSKLSPSLRPAATLGAGVGAISGTVYNMSVIPAALKGALWGVASKMALNRLGPTLLPAIKRARPYAEVLAPVERPMALRLTAGVPIGRSRNESISLAEYEKQRDRLQTLDLDRFAADLEDAEMSRAMAMGAPPEVAQESIDRKIKALEYIIRKFEEIAAKGNKYSPEDIRSLVNLPHNSPYKPTPSERYQLSQYVRAAEDPESLVKDMADGRLTPQAVEVWQELYPEALEELRFLVTETVRAHMNQGRYSSHQLRQINTLMGVPPDAEYVQMMQANHAAASEPTEGAPSAPPPPTGGVLADAYETRIQSVLRGM